MYLFRSNLMCICVLILLLILGCKTGNEKNGSDKDSSHRIVDTGFSLPHHDTAEHKMTFFDSVASQFAISIDQIKNYTMIDSIYWTGVYQGGHFFGDSIYFREQKHPLLVLNYSDALVCTDLFLLVFDSSGMHNSDYRIIEMNCDADESSDHSDLSYQILNDSTIMLERTSYEKKQGHKDHVSVQKGYLHLKSDGKFQPLPGLD
jgi:hypothetical protein